LRRHSSEVQAYQELEKEINDFLVENSGQMYQLTEETLRTFTVL
jgi:hypothetical protein